MKYTIKQISEMANVAQSTVSKALNGQKGVSEEKRKEILKLVGEVNYHPNISARGLSHKKTENIALVIPSSMTLSTSSHLFWTNFIVSIVEEASKHNYNVLLLIPQEKNPLKNIGDAIFKGLVDGFIVPSEQLSIQEVELFKENNIPFVLQGRSLISDQCAVDLRNEDGAKKLTKKLIDKNCKSIACIAGPEQFLYTKERVVGFKRELNENDLIPVGIFYTNYEKENVKETTKKIFSLNKEPDALFVTAGGEFISHILEALQELNIDAKNLPIALFDNYELFSYNWKNIISAYQPIKEMGCQDVKNLLQLINKEPVPSLSLFDIVIE